LRPQYKGREEESCVERNDRRRYCGSERAARVERTPVGEERRMMEGGGAIRDDPESLPFVDGADCCSRR